MIYDRIENLSLLPLPQEMTAKIARFIARAEGLPDGKHEIDGKLIYASKFSYTTADAGVFEAHRRYADLQILLAGQEQIGVTLDTPAREKTAYDENGDAVIYLPDAAYSSLVMRPGYFALLLPHDIHMPGVALDHQPGPVTKIVIKIAVELFSDAVRNTGK